MATRGGHGVSQIYIKQAITSQNAEMRHAFGGRLSDDRQSSLEALVETYVMDVAAHCVSKSRLEFAHKRKDVHALNQAIRSALRSNDQPQTETMFSTETGKRAFASDDRIVFTRNDKDIGVKNGMLGTVIKARTAKSPLRWMRMLSARLPSIRKSSRASIMDMP